MPNLPLRALFFGLVSLSSQMALLADEAEFRWHIHDLSRFPDPEVVALATDDQGNKWFGTRKGLTRLNQLGDWQTFTTETTGKGLPSNVITALAIGQNRELWVATEGGVSWYANGSWRAYTKENTSGGLPDNFVTSLAIGKEERWFGTKAGFSMLRGSAWTTYGPDRISGRLPHKMVTAIAVDSNGDKWLGTIAGLVKYNNTTWTTMTRDNTNSGLPHNSITCITVAPDGARWIGTQMGAAKLAGAAWTSYKGLGDLGEIASEQVYNIFIEKPTGVTWISAKGGSARFNGTSWKLYNKNNTTGIQTRYVYAAMVDKDGGAWFATQKGVSEMVPVLKEE